MYYIDSDYSIQESDTKTVFRYFGGDSQLSGGYITDTLYDTPEEAKSDLALSNVDWDKINTAEYVAIGQVECTLDDKIIDLEELTPTDETLTWTPVSESTDYVGGGMEHILQNDFNNIVEVVDVKEFTSCFGYISNDDIYHINDDNYMDEFDNLEYDIQKEDVEDDFKTLMGEEDYITDSNEEWQYNVGDDVESVDTLIEDEFILTEDFEEWYSFVDDESDDPGRDSRSYGDDNGYEY